MSKLKKNVFDEKAINLKRADQKKSNGSSDGGLSHGLDFFGEKRISNGKPLGSNVKVKKKLPLVVDIIVGILMLALVAAVILGSYMLFRYYTNDYETRSITCKVIFSVDDAELYEGMSGDLFVDENGNSVYFGKIKELKPLRNTESGVEMALTATVNVKYRSGEGYFVGDSRLAVGSVFTLRHVENTFSVTVVDIIDKTGGK